MTNLERRADFLAEKFHLSLQLTLIWVQKNPERSKRPMLASAVRELRRWASISGDLSSGY